MKAHYKEMLDKGQCWCQLEGYTRKVCPLGPKYLESLYSWSEDNPVNSMLAWKICEPCKEGTLSTEMMQTIAKQILEE